MIKPDLAYRRVKVDTSRRGKRRRRNVDCSKQAREESSLVKVLPYRVQKEIHLVEFLLKAQKAVLQVNANLPSVPDNV